MRSFTTILGLVAALMAANVFATTTNTTALVGIDQGASRSYVASGGHLDVESNGYVDFQSGASLKLAGTAITATAAEINASVAGLTATSTQVNNVINGSFCVAGGCTETSTTNAGALSVTKLQSLISAAGAESRTLAAPGGNGLLKIIAMTVHGGDVTLVGTNIWGETAHTCTFAAVGDTIIMMSAGGKWVILGKNGATCA